MSYLKSCITAFMLVASIATLSSQTADEVISKYVDAIGGKAALSKVNSIYAEYALSVMGNESTSATVVLNGKGYKTVSDAMGQKIINCVTDKGGWMINPMGGSDAATDLPADQYNAAKYNIYIDLLSNYSANGYKAELAGTEKVGSTETYKIKMTSPDNAVSYYFIDKATSYIVKIENTAEMMGQTATVTTTLSDYRKSDQGIALPYLMEVDYGQFQLAFTAKKVEFNKPVDPVIFEKGNTSL